VDDNSTTVKLDEAPLGLSYAGLPATISLDQAAAVDEGRRSSSTTSLYLALLSSLPQQDQEWVLDVVARHRKEEREAEERGEPLAGPAW
jgi:hypothetical protein